VHNLVLTDTIPVSTSLVAATQPYTLNDQLITWQLPVLTAGSPWGITLTVQSPYTFSGTITNSAYGLSSDEFGSLAGLPVQTDIFGLALGKTTPAAAVMAGNLLTYTLTVTNLHPITSTYNLVLSDTLPTGTQFITATAGYTLSSDQVFWTLDQLASGNTWQVQLVVRVDPYASGTIINSDYQVSSEDVATPIAGEMVKTLVWHKIWMPFMLSFP
jgi:uncharacterized repeat protein (TIGR01451 family)